MDENKKNDFWESSNDDFWSKSVVSDDWLKKDESDIWGQNSNNNFWNNDSTKEEDVITDEKREAVNPYLQSIQEQAERQQSIQQEKKSQRATVLNGQALDAPKEKLQVHTIICLSFIALAILSVVIAIVSYSVVKRRAIDIGQDVSYEDLKAGYFFMYDNNNSVDLAKEAVVLVSEKNFTGFPKGQKLIAIELEVFSDEYVSGANVLRDMYIGYDLEGRKFYRSMPMEDWVYPYVAAIGISREEILDNYGLGNGIINEGYLFFFVPSDVEEITLYIPRTEKKGGINVIESVRGVTMPVVEVNSGEGAEE